MIVIILNLFLHFVILDLGFFGPSGNRNLQKKAFTSSCYLCCLFDYFILYEISESKSASGTRVTHLAKGGVKSGLSRPILKNLGFLGF